MKLSHLAGQLSLEMRGEDVEITAIAPLEVASGETLSFLTDGRHLEACSKAAAIMTTPQLAAKLTMPLLVSATPALDLAKAARLLNYQELTVTGIHPTAVIHETARLAPGVVVGPLAVIGAQVEIGEDTVIHAGAIIHERSIIGARCIIQSHAVIGSEGYAYEWDGQRHQRIPHFGIVRIGNDVEIGAGTTIDRARFAETVVGDGTKMDNLVQIGHNCIIGRHCLIIAQVGIAGSCRIEDGVVLAGQAGVAPHLTIGRGARIAASSGVAENVPAGVTWSGWWATGHKENLAGIIALRKLPEFMRKVTAFMKKYGE
ncbi:MAG: UDP-3-O-(3-hydroxymyristoyl)glucosamine N-acyltransferase [Magnetococcales bacterium]|nr:UDP-3-O-(3-hydroxymyristoyl)glucosamine N-acyltransferase [Magnetococcales bacterium]NGZ25337.1 UDP-3-O-(3-hydroxymyristoyl)glucosamine N-acyltransferase [Magnetococcales bacterium]